MLVLFLPSALVYITLYRTSIHVYTVPGGLLATWHFGVIWLSAEHATAFATAQRHPSYRAPSSATAHSFMDRLLACLTPPDGELLDVVHQLQAALERADVRNAILQSELDDAMERAAAAEEDCKAYTVAIRWIRARPITSLAPKISPKRRRRSKKHDTTSHLSAVLKQPAGAPSPSASIVSSLEAFRVLLKEVLTMREEGRYDAELMHRYSDALVALPDADLEHVNLMLTKICKSPM